MTKASRKTPVRHSLREDSQLQSHVKNGLSALKVTHRDFIDESLRVDFADSLDLDDAMKSGHEQENRWDYLFGHLPSNELVALEPHSAKQDEIATVIKKRASALEQLKGHLKPGAQVKTWLWVASGSVQFANTEKARRRLDQNGIDFVGRKVLARHLPAGETNTPKSPLRAGRKGKR